MNKILFFFYTLILFNIFIWMIVPEAVFGVLWKWDIFYVILMSPLLYESWKNEQTSNR